MNDIPQVALDALALIEGIKRRALADIAQYPGSNAAQITRRIGYNDSQRVLSVLKDAEREGTCRSHRETGPHGPTGAYLWELV